MEYQYESIRVEKVEDRILVMSFCRPDKMNSWNKEVLSDLYDFSKKIHDDQAASVVVLRADGEKAYCTGLDFPDVMPEQVRANVVIKDPIVKMITGIGVNLASAPQIVINSAFGYTIGGGFITAMAADIRVCADTVKYSLPLLKLGGSCGDMGSTYFLCRQIPAGVARDILLTGRAMNAEEAYRLGFVSECVPFAELDEVVMKKAKEIASYNPYALKMSKELLNHGQDAMCLQDVIMLENRTNAYVTMYKQNLAQMEESK